MKLLYIAICDLWANGEVGIKNKVFSQLKSLEKKSETYIVTWKNMMFCTFRYNQLIDKKVLLSSEAIYRYIEEFVEERGIDMIFLRYLQTNPWLNEFLKNMKKKKRIVVIDFPTIPYDEEIKGRVELEEDRAYRGELKKYVRYSTNYNGLDSVFGIPSIQFHNGVNLEDIPIKSNSVSKDITLIAVASMNFWHGYDRLIRGMADYYKTGADKQKVYVRLVGLGKEIPRYQELIKENNLDEYIKLVGIMQGEDLDEEFNKADIAVGSLGMYRVGMQSASPIKAKEYCAKGIPIVLGYNDLAFPEELEFICKVPNDDTNIGIDNLLKFYEDFRQDGSKKKIREYAQKSLTWDIQFEKLFTQIS